MLDVAGNPKLDSIHPSVTSSGRCKLGSTSGATRRMRILVVDDEHLIADSLVEILTMFGFDASCRYSGSQAIDRANTEAFDVLITDVVMNEMTGIEAAIEICKVLPTCKVLLMSGNTRTSEMLKAALEQGHDFDIVAKPVHPSVILDRLKAMSIVN